MDDVAELQSRITAALDRIRSGLDNIGDASANAEPSPELLAQLDDERLANAQLEERVRALKNRQDGKISDLEARVAAQKAQLVTLDGELQKLRASQADLRELTRQLRDAAMAGVAQPELINRATMAELDAITAQRDADAAEVDAILSELKPLLSEDTHATG
jgi:chromosome segregation ATPase